jgi:hypothetical protein
MKGVSKKTVLTVVAVLLALAVLYALQNKQLDGFAAFTEAELAQMKAELIESERRFWFIFVIGVSCMIIFGIIVSAVLAR